MKNLLSENMLRFGTKNLSESQMQRLTEAVIDLSKTPGIDKANKYFQNAFINKLPPIPGYILGQYYLLSDVTVNYGTAESISGPVYGFLIENYGGTPLPVISNGRAGEGGRFSYFDRANKIKFVNWETMVLGIDESASNVEIARNINTRFDVIPLTVLQTLYNADPNKSNFDKAIATFKAAKAPWTSLLTGTAKLFYDV